MTGWQYTQNRLTAVTSRNWTFTYDLNGNRATANWNGTVHGYAYDPFGNLIVVSGPIGYHAVYDAFGRRVRYETPQGEFTFIYEGDTLFGEADIDGMRAVYIWGLLGPIARIDLRSPSGTRYYVLDGLGHTRLLLDSSGSITDRYSYDAWGNPIEQVGGTFNPFRWNAAAGYEWTPATGLYHVGAREYDPRTARWLQKDPIDVASGDPNLYRYCGNDPINASDDGMRGDAKQRGARGKKSSFVAQQKVALIAVGDIESGWWSQWAVNWGVRRDVALLKRRFSAAGYEVKIDWQCSKPEILAALRSRNIRAFAFVGHNAFVGALAPYGGQEGDESSFVDPSDIENALGKRRLDWAIIHACYTDTPELRQALVGNSGRWEASKGAWDPVIGVDWGSFGWWKGKWQRKHRNR